MEARRRNPDDRVQPAVDANPTADNSLGATESGTP
jgi:hypothetical protein